MKQIIEDIVQQRIHKEIGVKTAQSKVICEKSA
jgi:hypothetical protein